MDTIEIIRGLKILTQRAASISQNTQNRSTTQWEVMIASLVFARLTLNSFSILRLSPGSSFCSPVNGAQIWDLPSIASLSRNLVDAYLMLRYMCEPMRSPSEAALRQKVWEYHEASERYKMMDEALPHSARLDELRAQRDKLRTAVRAADDQRVAATVSADRVKLAAVLSDELRYAHSSGLVDTKKSYVESIASGRTKYHIIEFVERNFTFPATGIALESGRAHMKATSPTGLNDAIFSFLAVWREENGQWRLLAWQSCKLPPATSPETKPR